MPDIHVKSADGRIDIHISSDRIMDNVKAAQNYLDNAVLTDCNQYIPFDNGKLRESGILNTVLGSGVVQWETPYAHYQYEGEKYIDPKYHCGAFYVQNVGYRSRKGVPKVPSGKPLQYHTEGTGDHWFETAKAANGKEWIQNVKKIAGGK